MHQRRRCDAGFGDLAGEIHFHLKLLAQHTGRHHAAQTAEFDGLEAAAARGLASMVLLEVFDTVQPFIEGDGNIGCGRDFCHAVDIAAGNGLFEKIESCTIDRFYICKRLLDAITLVCIGRNQQSCAEGLAHAARAHRII